VNNGEFIPTKYAVINEKISDQASDKLGFVTGAFSNQV
jgi:hypothetical protein